MSSSSATFSLDHLSPPPSEQLCYVHCSFCDTVLAVSVPCSSLFKTVTVRCGHCTNLLSVNMRSLLFPASNQLHLGHAFLAPPHHNLLDELACPPPSLLTDPMSLHNCPMPPAKATDQEERPPNAAANRPPEKRQRVPSAYNRFIKDEIQRIKAGNPDITHREAFSAAAKNWAHFPHIHFGLMPDQGLKKNSIRQQDELACPPPSLLTDPMSLHNCPMPPAKATDQEERPPNAAANRPPEKRQRVPSAYNRFIKDEIQRIKAGNPDITHREAFSAAAKNWAHFPHIHFGLMPDQGLKKNSIRQQEGEDVLLKDGFYAAAANMNMGVTRF